MKLWISGETEDDIAEDYRKRFNIIEPEVNRILGDLSFSDDMERWSFIAIILSEKFLDAYPEIVRRSLKRRTLEFRLHILHAEFKQASAGKQMTMIFDALTRSVDLMPKLKVSPESQQKLRAALAQARRSLLAE